MEECRADPRPHVSGPGALDNGPRAVRHIVRPDAHPNHLPFKAETSGVRDRPVLPILQRERVPGFQTPGEALRVVGFIHVVV